MATRTFSADNLRLSLMVNNLIVTIICLNEKNWGFPKNLTEPRLPPPPPQGCNISAISRPSPPPPPPTPPQLRATSWQPRQHRVDARGCFGNSPLHRAHEPRKRTNARAQTTLVVATHITELKAATAAAAAAAAATSSEDYSQKFRLKYHDLFKIKNHYKVISVLDPQTQPNPHLLWMLL